MAHLETPSAAAHGGTPEQGGIVTPRRRAKAGAGTASSGKGGRHAQGQADAAVLWTPEPTTATPLRRAPRGRGRGAAGSPRGGSWSAPGRHACSGGKWRHADGADTDHPPGIHNNPVNSRQMNVNLCGQGHGTEEDGGVEFARQCLEEILAVADRYPGGIYGLDVADNECVDAWCRWGPGLTFRGCSLSDEAICLLLDGLMEHGIVVRVLRIHRNRLSGASIPTLLRLCQVQRERVVVREVHLSHNNITTADAIALIEGLKPLYPYDHHAIQGAEQVPLWLRVEHNLIDPDMLQSALRAQGIPYCLAQGYSYHNRNPDASPQHEHAPCKPNQVCHRTEGCAFHLFSLLSQRRDLGSAFQSAAQLRKPKPPPAESKSETDDVDLGSGDSLFLVLDTNAIIHMMQEHGRAHPFTFAKLREKKASGIVFVVIDTIGHQLDSLKQQDPRQRVAINKFWEELKVGLEDGSMLYLTPEGLESTIRKAQHHTVMGGLYTADGVLDSDGLLIECCLILRTALWEQQGSHKLVLLTNDKNCRTRAIQHGNLAAVAVSTFATALKSQVHEDAWGHDTFMSVFDAEDRRLMAQVASPQKRPAPFSLSQRQALQDLIEASRHLCKALEHAGELPTDVQEALAKVVHACDAGASTM